VAATRVAVVDDDHTVRDLLEAILIEEGYAVTSIPPGADLLADIKAARPAIIVLDWRVGTAGGSAFAAIRADPALAQVPVLICTGDLDGMRSEAPRLATQPHVAIVEKPFQMDVLLAVTERLVSATPAPAPIQPGELREDLRAAIERRGATSQARAVLNVLRATGDWSCAELWLNDRGLLLCVAAVSNERHRGFARQSRRTRLVPGFGLPGRVWNSARPAWIPSIEADRNFPRAAAARRFGVRSAAGFPVWFGGSVVGVLAVYAGSARQPDEGLTRELASMASGLGPWVDEVRGELLRPDPVSAAARLLAHEAAQLADVAAVDVLDDEGDLHRLAVAHRDPAMTEVAMRLEAFSPAPEGPVARAVETGEVQRLAVSDSTLRRWSASPEHLLVLRALMLHSLLTVPLVHEENVIGSVTLSSADPSWHASVAASDAAAALAAPAAADQLGRLIKSRGGGTAI
jgi:DNA-binding response OmpR family regulator